MKVLVLSPHKTKKRFSRQDSSYVLAAAFDRYQISWDLHQPWEPNNEISRYDVVLCWPYSLQKQRFMWYARKFEKSIKMTGIPVANSLQDFSVLHSTNLRRWKENNIPCANYQHFNSLTDINLKYPLLLRVDGVHRGRQIFLARTPFEAKQIIDNDRRYEVEFPKLNLAIEFEDTKYSDGFYRKRRSHVINNKLIPRQQSLSRDWKINLEHSSHITQARNEDRLFIENGEENPDLVKKAAKVLGSEIVAIDYTRKEDGDYIFWEANRNFQLSVKGEMIDNFMLSTGRTYKECTESLDRIGDAIVELLCKKANNYISY